LLVLRRTEADLIPQIDEAVADLRLRQLEAANDLGSGFERAFIKIKKEANDLASVGESVVDVFANQATNALTEFASTGKFVFKDFANALLKDITRIIAKLLVMKAIEAGVNAFSQAPSSDTISTARNAGRAGGGTVQPGQAPMPVNEEGKELFLPNRTGTIVPNIASAQQKPPEVKVQVNVVDDPEALPELIDTGIADTQIINVILRNSDKVKQVIS
jgi:phage-related minor tail protein